MKDKTKNMMTAIKNRNLIIQLINKLVKEVWVSQDNNRNFTKTDLNMQNIKFHQTLCLEHLVISEILEKGFQKSFHRRFL